MFGTSRKTVLPAPAEALPGRATPLRTAQTHFVNGNALKPPFPAQMQTAILGLGCFWGAERRFWQLPGVHVTAAGYAGGFTSNPTYEEVCSGRTGHAEVVLVVFDPAALGYDALLQSFWEAHDPTQAMRQGNDIGTQYRSIILVADDAQQRTAERSLQRYQQALTAGGFGAIATTIEPAGEFFYAEDYHQQYLAKNPGGYCGLGGTGVSCPG